MNNILNTQLIKPTVNARRVMSAVTEAEFERRVQSRISAGDLLALYATPVIMNFACLRILEVLRGAMIASHVVDEARRGQRVTDLIKEAGKALDDELARISRDGHKDLADWIRKVAGQWIEERALAHVESIKNVFASIMLKRRMGNDNDNLRDLCSYAMTARVIANEAKECEQDIAKTITDVMQGTGVRFVLHGESVTIKLLTASNMLCSRLGTPSYEETLTDKRIDTGIDNWRRSVAMLIEGIKMNQKQTRYI